MKAQTKEDRDSDQPGSPSKHGQTSMLKNRWVQEGNISREFPPADLEQKGQGAHLLRVGS